MGMEIPAKAGLGHGTFVSLTRLGKVSLFSPLALLSVLIMFGLENWQGSKDKCTLQISYHASQSLGMCLSVVSLLGVQNIAVHSWGMVGQQTEEEEKYLKYFYLQHQGQSQVRWDNEGEEIPLNIWDVCSIWDHLGMHIVSEGGSVVNRESYHDTNPLVQGSGWKNAGWGLAQLWWVNGPVEEALWEHPRKTVVQHRLGLQFYLFIGLFFSLTMH